MKTTVEILKFKNKDAYVRVNDRMETFEESNIFEATHWNNGVEFIRDAIEAMGESDYELLEVELTATIKSVKTE